MISIKTNKMCVFLVHPRSRGLWAVRLQHFDEGGGGLQEGGPRLQRPAHLAVI